MLVILKRDSGEIDEQAAQILAGAIKKKPALTLGLATGGTMVGVYENLVRLHKTGSVDFSLPLLVLVAQETSALLVEGRQGQAKVIQVQGKNYVEVEELARIAGGSLRFVGNQIILRNYWRAGNRWRRWHRRINLWTTVRFGRQATNSSCAGAGDRVDWLDSDEVRNPCEESLHSLTFVNVA